MLKKITVYAFLMMFLFTNLSAAQSIQEMTVMDKMTFAEKIIYGADQTGSLIERTDRMERDLFGEATSAALTTKLDVVCAYLAENSANSPSFQSTINAVEWTITRQVTDLPAKTKVEQLETALLGSPETGNLDDRADKLAQLSYPAGRVEVSPVTIYQDTLVKIKMVSELDSRKNRAGDVVIYETAEDVYSSGLLVIPQGTRGEGKIAKVQQPKNFGRDAVLQISFDKITAFDGTAVGTELGDKAKAETKSLVKAAGASVAGMALLGPVGVVGGAFVKGSNVTVPEGAELYIQVSADTSVYGLLVD